LGVKREEEMPVPVYMFIQLNLLELVVFGSYTSVPQTDRSFTAEF
jgi:hypothetical protein